jgi:transcriptional regulator with XRE-family HTH domain
VVVVRNHVRQVRENLGLTQREVAARCGFANPATLSRIERIETAPRSRTLEKLAVALGVEPRTLVP